VIGRDALSIALSPSHRRFFSDAICARAIRIGECVARMLESSNPIEPKQLGHAA
jgi:hypothetical protein